MDRLRGLGCCLFAGGVIAGGVLVAVADGTVIVSPANAAAETATKPAGVAKTGPSKDAPEKPAKSATGDAAGDATGKAAAETVRLKKKADVIAAMSGKPFEQWRDALWPEAETAGITRETFDAAFKDLKPDFKLPDLIIPGVEKDPLPTGSQAEFSKTPADYLREKTLVFLTKRGQELAKTHGKDLDAIEKKFGVGKSLLLGFWGRETSFGSYKPRHDIIRALATQAYVGRRKAFFRKEFLLAMKMVQEKHAPRDVMTASWAGATGLTQFIPSDFYSYAVDFDGDGRRNLWTSVPDALASTAKSMIDNGWVANKPWGYEARVEGKLDCTLEGKKKARPLKAWKALGFKAMTDDGAFPKDTDEDVLSLLLPAGTYGPAFLMTKNFQVIKTYNFSNLYALFVGHLGDRIGGGGNFKTAWQPVKILKERQVIELQTMLNDLGFDSGKVDGKVGPATRNGLGAFQKAKGFKLDCYPNVEALKSLREFVSKKRADAGAETLEN